MAKTYEIDGITTNEPWEKTLVMFYEDYDGWDALMCRVSKFGNLSTGGGPCNHGETLGSCMGAFRRGIKRALDGATIGRLVLDGPQIITSRYGEPCFFCDPNDEDVHEGFKRWAESLFGED